MNFKPTFYWLFMLIVLYSCNKEDDFVIDFKYEYFPVEIGSFVVYNVDSIKFIDNEPTVSDTAQYQIKELIESVFVDNEGRDTYRIERYKRRDSLSPWVIEDVWFSNRTQTTAERIEENLRFIKLVFPPKIGLTWDGNVFIDIHEGIEWLEDWEYEITELDVPNTVNELSFDSTLTVLQEDNQADFVNVIEKIYSIEVYAKHVGLVSKELQVLKKEPIALWTEPTSGFIVRMEIAGYGTL